MAKETKKNASRVGSKAMKKSNLIRPRNMSVVNDDFSDALSMDHDAVYLMKGIDGKVSPRLMDLLNSMLLGFCDDMQFVMANDLLVFANSYIIHKTGCLSVDCVLGACYCWIAEEHGIDQEEIMKLMSYSQNQ